MMSEDSKSRSFSDNLILDNSEEGVVITGIPDDTFAARSGLKTGDEIVAATIHLDHLNKNEVLKILKVLEPYDDNMKVLTKKQLDASADLGSFGLGLKDPAKMLNLKKDLSLDASAQAPVVSLDGLNGKLNGAPGFGGKIGGPTLNGDLPSLGLNKPSADAGARFTMPSLGLTGPDVKGDLDGSIKAPNVSVSAPKLNAPNASLNIEKPGIKTGNAKYKAPHFSMPHFNLPQVKTPKANADVSSSVDLPSFSGNLNAPNLNLPAPELDLKKPDWNLNGPKVDMNGPDINFKTPNADIEAPSHKIKWPHQKWKGPKVKGLDADLNTDLSAPDFSLNTPKIDGDLSAPDVDINLPKANFNSPDLDVQTPNLDIDAPSSKIHWPHKWKMPKLHGPKADLDLDANLDTPDVDASLPKLEGGINASDINWPHKKWKKPKLHGPKASIDADLNGPDLNFSSPKIDGDINVPNPELNLPKADLNGPNLDFQAPDLDMDGKQINWPHLKWKKPKLHGPKVDLSSPDVDLSVPKIEGDLSTPGMDLNLPKADVDVKAPDGKIKFPTLRKPKFLFSGPKVKSPDVDLDANVKAPDLNLSPKASFDAPDLDLNLPRGDVDVKAPNLDIEGNSGKIKWPTIKKPKWLHSDPKIDGLDADVSAPDLNLTAPKIDGGINAPDVNLNLPKADLKGPELDLNTPDLDGSGFKWFNFKKPKFGTLKGPKGDIDADLKVPDMDLKTVDMNMSAPKIKGGIKTPDLNIGMPDIDLPKGNVAAPNLDLKAPDLNMSAPKFGFNAPDLDLNVPKADLKGPGIDLKAPEVDASAGTVKIPKIDLPKFGWSGPKVKGPNINLDADTVDFPGVNLDLPTADVKAPNLNLPSIKGDLSTPDVDLSAPNTDINLSTLNIKAPQGNFNLPKANLTGPSLDLPKADFKVPDLNLNAPDLSLSSPKINGNLSAPVLKAPNMDINLPKADLKAPDAQLKSPDLDFKSDLGDFNFPHFKLPKLGLSSPEVEVPSVNPSMEAGIEAPKINIGAPKGSIKVPEVPNVDANLEKSKFSTWKFPKISLPGHKIDAGDVNTGANLEFSPDVKIKTPSVEGGINSPDVSVSAPEVKTSLNAPQLDITAKADADVEGSPKTKSRWPFKWGLNSSSATTEEVSGDDLETDMGDVVFPVFKTHRLPRNSLDGIGGIEDILSLSKLDTESKDYIVSKGIRLPIINTNSKAGGKIDIMERLKMAKEKTNSTNSSPTEACDLKLSAQSLNVGTLTDADSALVRGGTFKVEKPEPALGLVAPEISTSDENKKLSLVLDNMLGLN